MNAWAEAHTPEHRAEIISLARHSRRQKACCINRKENALSAGFVFILDRRFFFLPARSMRSLSMATAMAMSEQKQRKQILYKDVNNQAQTNKQTPKCADGEMTRANRCAAAHAHGYANAYAHNGGTAEANETRTGDKTPMVEEDGNHVPDN